MPEKTVKRRPQNCDAALASDDGRRLYESSEGQTRASAPLLSPAGCWVTDRKNENCCRGKLKPMKTTTSLLVPVLAIGLILPAWAENSVLIQGTAASRPTIRVSRKNSA